MSRKLKRYNKIPYNIIQVGVETNCYLLLGIEVHCHGIFLLLEILK